MAWYRSGTVTSVAGTNIITGTSTQWNNPIFGIASGQMIFVPGAGQVVIYEILAVDSDTKIRVTKNIASEITNSEYAIVTTVSNSMSDLARRTAVQLALYQGLLEDWQLITTSTGNVTIIAPDGTEVVIPSLAQISQDVSNKLSVQSTFLSTDLNLAVTSGIYHPTTATANLPIAALGVMEVYVRQGGTSLVQIFHATVMTVGNTNRHFVRIGALSAGVWSFSTWAEQYTSLTKPALTDLSGTLPVTSGGTGATTLAGAQSALGIVTDAFGAGQVSGTPWVNMTLYNGWTVLGANNRCRYRKVLGMVFMEFAAAGGTVSTITTLPVGYRPLVSVIAPAVGTPASISSISPRLTIDAAGGVTADGYAAGSPITAVFCFSLQ
ncbi:pyocin knob domain-containing protein [Yersinia enterocolitica]|uniref:pyocin knob domain-containing protein n=1 Tax=Yersinia enterocolitica TaxID=630 RepID=UPI003CFEBE3C